MNHRVLNRSEILELVDEHCAPSRSYCDRDVIESKQIRRLHHEHVEVDEISLVEEFDVVDVEVGIARIHPEVIDEPMRRELRKRVLLPPLCNTHPAKHTHLVIFVGDTEARLEA